MPRHNAPPRAPFNLDDIEALIDRLVVLAFKAAGALVIILWLLHHVAQELHS